MLALIQGLHTLVQTYLNNIFPTKISRQKQNKPTGGVSIATSYLVVYSTFRLLNKCQHVVSQMPSCTNSVLPLPAAIISILIDASREEAELLRWLNEYGFPTEGTVTVIASFNLKEKTVLTLRCIWKTITWKLFFHFYVLHAASET